MRVGVWGMSGMMIARRVGLVNEEKVCQTTISFQNYIPVPCVIFEKSLVAKFAMTVIHGILSIASCCQKFSLAGIILPEVFKLNMKRCAYFTNA